jgi:5-methylcytosine-specific restriction endonuclease McrA
MLTRGPVIVKSKTLEYRAAYWQQYRATRSPYIQRQCSDCTAAGGASARARTIYVVWQKERKGPTRRTYAKRNRTKHGSVEQREWRQLIFERDDFTCQFCGARGGRLQADHILPFSTHPRLRYELSNGRTLCVPCHQTTPTYGWRGYWLKRRQGEELAAKRLRQETLFGASA